MNLSISPIPEALERLAAGQMLVVVDGPDRENEGDLTMAAEFITAEHVNFMLRFGRGLVCMPCDHGRLDELRIGPMVPPADCTNDTAFAVTIDHHRNGTGISATDRAQTIRGVVDRDARPWDFRRPGHVFPLRARPGGVLERPGHTEASVDLCRLADLYPCAAICEVLDDAGTPARLPELLAFAETHGLAVASVDDVVEHRLASEATLRAARPGAGLRT